MPSTVVPMEIETAAPYIVLPPPKQPALPVPDRREPPRKIARISDLMFPADTSMEFDQDEYDLQEELKIEYFPPVANPQDSAH